MRAAGCPESHAEEEWPAGGGKPVIYNWICRGVAQPGSAPALGAHTPALNALLVLTTSNENNNLGNLLFAQTKVQSPKQKGF